ncbi:MAG: hypothetical protein QE271_02305 [Bacteriovoracaceae bacterium]|nr:hypothetical protein [Bacteriovoracaceae bacterium]
MVVANKTYPAKILVFGEYTILFGGKGVVVPYNQYFGQWSFGEKDHSYFEQSKELFKFIKALKEQNSKTTAMFQFFDLQEFSQDLMEGIYFQSTIPQGLGMGSSGALCAAIWERYFRSSISLSVSETRSALALIEAFYHHSSSGLDPLVSLLQRPLCLHGPDQIHFFDDEAAVQKNLKNMYLVNTKVSRKTAPLVQLFKNKIQDAHFKEIFESKFLPLSNQTVLAWLNHEPGFFELMNQFCTMQMELFPEYFIKEVRELALVGLKEQKFTVKLCGAGGGGVYLICNHDQNDENQLYFKDYLARSYPQVQISRLALGR